MTGDLARAAADGRVLDREEMTSACVGASAQSARAIERAAIMANEISSVMSRCPRRRSTPRPVDLNG